MSFFEKTKTSFWLVGLIGPGRARLLYVWYAPAPAPAPAHVCKFAGLRFKPRLFLLPPVQGHHPRCARCPPQRRLARVPPMKSSPWRRSPRRGPLALSRGLNSSIAYATTSSRMNTSRSAWLSARGPPISPSGGFPASTTASSSRLWPSELALNLALFQAHSDYWLTHRLS